MELATLIDRYRCDLESRYGEQLLPLTSVHWMPLLVAAHLVPVWY